MAKNRRNAQWFYALLVLMIVAVYVLVQFGVSASSSCSGRRTWEWKLPPGFVCVTTPAL